jgi:hypothetical protein
MANQLIPAPGMEPTLPEHLTHDQCLRLWADVVDAGEALLLAGLQRDVGPSGDVQEAYRRWYEQQMEEHDRAMRQQAENLFRRGVRHGR